LAGRMGRCQRRADDLLEMLLGSRRIARRARADANFAADGILFAVRAFLVGVARRPCDARTGRRVRLLVGAHFAIAGLQLGALLLLLGRQLFFAAGRFGGGFVLRRRGFVTAHIWAAL